MKTLLKILLSIILIPYVAVVIFLTACLLNYNDYNITEFGKYTLLIIGDEKIEGYNKGDLVVVKKNDDTEVKVNDNVFFYSVENKQIVVNYGPVVDKKEVTNGEDTYVMEGDYKTSSKYVIGKGDTSKVYAKAGSVLSFLESRWGFLLCVIFPVMLMFIYEIYALIIEIKTKED